METYLKEQYGVFEDEQYLLSESDIKDYFKGNGYEWLDCGQGYYQDEADLIVKIDEKFYDVHISAEIGSSKQDRGDRSYYVERITDVAYKEIPKPELKPLSHSTIHIDATAEQLMWLLDQLKERNIKHSIFDVTFLEV